MIKRQPENRETGFQAAYVLSTSNVVLRNHNFSVYYHCDKIQMFLINLECVSGCLKSSKNHEK